jgi:DHA1 family multidrug resistance protein-like MFS transporter
LLKRYNEPWIVVGGTLVRALGLFLYAVIATPYLGVLASVITAIGMGVMMPPLQSMSTRTVADELRGGVLGIYQSTISLSTIISTAIAGVIFAFNPTYPFWIGGLLSMLVLAPALLLVKQMGGKLSKPETAVAPAD